jgi:acetoin utilization deacetylase AcuC-like enzyme
VYREALAELVLPAFAAFVPTWLLISAGYDAHRRDPLTGLGLAAGDFADITAELLTTVAPARTVLFLEGGYDLEALTASVAATCSTLAGEHHRPEPATSGGPGLEEVARVRRFRDELGYA